MTEPSQAATLVTIGVFLLSLIAIFLAFVRHIGGNPLLTYEPRQRVPWSILAASIPLLLVLLAVFQWINTLFPEIAQWLNSMFPKVFGIPKENTTAIDPSDFILNGLLNSVVMIGLTLLALAGLSIASNANASDLGLPKHLRQLAKDIGIGCFACLISLLPIFGLHYLLNVIFQPEHQHQLIELLQEHRSPQLMLVGVLMAVVAAPLSEEFIFRLLLQGWLERREDELLDFQASARKTISPEFADLEPLETTEPQEQSESEKPELPSPPTLLGLPHGWLPILISGTLFGLAHLSHGVSAVPLIFFGIILGYLYQRTHRLTPSIAAHMFFNAYTMGLLWLG